MTLGSFTAAASKLVIGEITKPTIASLRRQIASRGSQYADLSERGGCDKELDQAIAVLADNAATLPEAIALRLRGKLTQRPSSFNEQDAKLFIADDRVIALAKAGARKVFGNTDITEELAEARAVHEDLFGGDGIFGETLLDEAIRYAVFVLLAHLTPGDRLVIEFLHAKSDAIQSDIAAVQDKLAPIASQVDALYHASVKGSPAVEQSVLDDAVAREVRQLRRLRFVHGDALAPQAEALGARLDGGLSGASDAVRAEAFREIAIVLSRAKRPDDAEAWTDRAYALGADVVCERARVAIARDDPEAAMRLLRDRDGTLPKSLMIEAINSRDGEAAALDYFEAHHSPGDLTGHALQAAAVRLTKAGRREDGIALLASADATQIDENPVLLFARAHLRIAGALPPDVAARYVEREGIIPHPSDLRDDEEGQRLLGAARDDLVILAATLPDLNAPDLSIMVDINLLFLNMCVGDASAREAGRAALVARLADPEEAVRYAPLAALHEIAVDWTAIREGLDRAERLGGFDDAQLSAAFTMTMKRDSAQGILAFVRKYRERLIDYQGKAVIVSIEAEALAKSGDIAGAKALAARESEALDANERSFLDAMIAEAEGGDAIAMRLAQFEASGSTHDLQILVGTLGAAQDDRLGEYLVRLWRLRHQIDDARGACNAFMTAGQEEAAEAFLEELAERARQDTYLHTHLAWARQRQGRLAEARQELAALVAAGTDDPNTRQLTVMLAVETGRWSDLEAFVQHELSAAADRTASELLASARIAQAIDSSAAMALARAAIAKEPADPHLNIGGYSIAVKAGCERTPEVAGWLAAARAGSGPEGPLFEKDFDEIVEWAKESRARVERLNSMISGAEIPFFVAMQALGGTQSALVIRQLAANAELTDSRKKVAFPLFAGNRVAANLDPKSIGFDPIALLILDWLGLLPRALAAFDSVVLPAGTLHSFFEDRVKSGPSQPSRIVQARAIKDRVASGVLKIEALPADSDLASITGEEFAALYVAAMARSGYVVDTAPLHPPGKLHETIDSEPYRAQLLSPLGVVRSLLAMGVISQSVAKAAEAFVAGTGPWEGEPEPRAGSPLFLSNLAVQYFSDAGLLPILKRHAGALVVLPEVAQFADREIAAATDGAEIGAGIERIRSAIAAALDTGKVRIGPIRMRRDESADGEESEKDSTIGPVMNVLRDGGGVEAFVCDDRAMNRYLKFDDRSGKEVPFLTTPDVLAILHRRALLTDAELAAARETLRIAGAGLMPLETEEIIRAVLGSNWAIGPNAELRTIRDSIHLPLARELVQLPQERVWFKSVSLNIGFAIRRAWQEVEDVTLAARAASYLLDMLPDPEAWSAGDESPDRALWVQDVSRHTLWGYASIFDLPADRAAAYRRWFETHVTPAALRRDPEVMDAMARALLSLFRMSESEADDAGE